MAEHFAYNEVVARSTRAWGTAIKARSNAMESKLSIDPLWRCESPDHNSESGCSNPECFKYNGVVDPRWAELSVAVDRIWKEIQEHNITIDTTIINEALEQRLNELTEE